MLNLRPTASRGAFAAALFTLALASAPHALAAGGLGADDEQKPAATDQTKGKTKAQDNIAPCPRGKIRDVKNQECVEKKSGVLPDADIAEYAFALATWHRYGEAIDMLDILQNPNTARALNYRGYATRKLGKLDEGIGFYLRSVAIDPNYTQVREYLGEAYLEQGKLDLAQQELDVIAKLCGGTSCRYYVELARAVELKRGG